MPHKTSTILTTCHKLQKALEDQGLHLEAGYGGAKHKFWAHLESDTKAYLGEGSTLLGAITSALRKVR